MTPNPRLVPCMQVWFLPPDRRPSGPDWGQDAEGGWLSFEKLTVWALATATHLKKAMPLLRHLQESVGYSHPRIEQALLELDTDQQAFWKVGQGHLNTGLSEDIPIPYGMLMDEREMERMAQISRDQESRRFATAYETLLRMMNAGDPPTYQGCWAVLTAAGFIFDRSQDDRMHFYARRANTPVQFSCSVGGCWMYPALADDPKFVCLDETGVKIETMNQLQWLLFGLTGTIEPLQKLPDH